LARVPVAVQVVVGSLGIGLAGVFLLDRLDDLVGPELPRLITALLIPAVAILLSVLNKAPVRQMAIRIVPFALASFATIYLLSGPIAFVAAILLCGVFVLAVFSPDIQKAGSRRQEARRTRGRPR
jgi:chromate transport protein ChrA